MAVTKIRTIKQVIRNVFGIMAVTMLICGCENNSDLSTGKSEEQTQIKETDSSQSETDTKTNSQNESRQDSQDKFISEEEAKKIAFDDAGIDNSNVSNMSIKMESDDGIWEYEIEFYVGNTEYDYDIDAISGAVRSKDVSNHAVPEVPTQPQTGSAPVQTQPSNNSVLQEGLITEEQAKQIAFGDAGVSESQVLSQRIKLEMDDGIWEYEVEFYVGSTEYDYEIDAASGTIRKKDMDIEDDFYQLPAQGNYISEADAKALALAKVSGASENNIQIHLDYDDGRAIYEGSIYYQGIEYEFEIDAVTGTFLDWDIDD